MVSWPWQPEPRSRTCDAPGCLNDSLPEHCMVLWPAVGPVLDVPLRLYFCDEHREAASLVDRYRAWQRASSLVGPAR
jgi:hypothetical protein